MQIPPRGGSKAKFATASAKFWAIATGCVPNLAGTSRFHRFPQRGPKRCHGLESIFARTWALKAQVASPRVPARAARHPRAQRVAVYHEPPHGTTDSARFGRHGPRSRRTWPKSVQIRGGAGPSLVGARPNLGEARQNSLESGQDVRQLCPDAGQARAISERISPMLTEFGAPMPGQICPLGGRTSPRVGRTGPEVGSRHPGIR